MIFLIPLYEKYLYNLFEAFIVHSREDVIAIHI